MKYFTASLVIEKQGLGRPVVGFHNHGFKIRNLLIYYQSIGNVFYLIFMWSVTAKNRIRFQTRSQYKTVTQRRLKIVRKSSLS